MTVYHKTLKVQSNLDVTCHDVTAAVKQAVSLSSTAPASGPRKTPQR